MSNNTAIRKDEEKRRNARDKVEGAARRGDSPREVFSDDDLAWAFGRDRDQIDQLEQVAEQARTRKRKAEQGRHEALALKTETKAVLDEWDAKRRQAAEAEARKRLGLDEPKGKGQ